MRQAFVPEVGTIAFRELEVPEPADGEVLLRVARIGICGSDVHVFRGEHPIVRPPLVQGHEFSGWVERCGEGVTDLAPGDLVTVEPAIGCGSCPKCRSGLIAQCSSLDFIGGNLPGAGAEYFAVDARQVLRMQPTTSPDDAAMTEPVACAVHAVARAGEPRDRSVFVAGGGQSETSLRRSPGWAERGASCSPTRSRPAGRSPKPAGSRPWIHGRHRPSSSRSGTAWAARTST